MVLSLRVESSTMADEQDEAELGQLEADMKKTNKFFEDSKGRFDRLEGLMEAILQKLDQLDRKMESPGTGSKSGFKVESSSNLMSAVHNRESGLPMVQSTNYAQPLAETVSMVFPGVDGGSITDSCLTLKVEDDYVPVTFVADPSFPLIQDPALCDLKRVELGFLPLTISYPRHFISIFRDGHKLDDGHNGILFLHPYSVPIMATTHFNEIFLGLSLTAKSIEVWTSNQFLASVIFPILDYHDLAPLHSINYRSTFDPVFDPGISVRASCLVEAGAYYHFPCWNSCLANIPSSMKFINESTATLIGAITWGTIFSKSLWFHYLPSFQSQARFLSELITWLHATFIEPCSYLISDVLEWGLKMHKDLVDYGRLYVGATHWGTIVISDANTIEMRELIFLATSSTVDVCLSNAMTGQPFISTLELRQFSGSVYYTQFEEHFYLSVSARINFGADSDAPIRYPDDPFDRIWELDSIKKENYLVGVVAGQPEISNAVVNIEENALGKYRLYEPGFTNLSLPFVLSFRFGKTSDSSRGPLLNALEINKYLEKNDGTLDEAAISDVASHYTSADWALEGGDPCLPVPWSWIHYSSDPQPRIVSVLLSAKNLTGNIPSSIAKLMGLVELWLDGNMLTGSIPDFTGCMELKIIHLENN